MINTIYQDYDGRRQFTAEHYQTYDEQRDILRQYIKDHPHDFIRWAEEHPEFQDTMTKSRASFDAGDPSPQNSQTKGFKRVLALLKQVSDALRCHHKDLRGTTYVKAKLYQDCKNHSLLNTTTSTINSGTLSLFLQFLWLNFPLGTGVLAAIGVSAAMARVQNLLCSEASRYTPDNKDQANGQLSILGMLNILFSVAGALGVAISLNAETVASFEAERILKTEILPGLKTIVSQNPLDDKVYRDLRSTCEQGQQELTTKEEGSIGRNDLFLTLYGVPFEDYISGSKPPGGICGDAAVRKATLTQKHDEAQTRLRFIEENRRSDGDLATMKAHYPARYTATFTEDGKVKDGVRLIAQSVNRIGNDLINLRLGNLTPLLFVMGLSLLTSAATLWVLYQYRFREDALLSHDAAMKVIIAEMFHWNQVSLETLPAATDDDDDGDTNNRSPYKLANTQLFALHQLKTLQQAWVDTGGYLPYPPLMRFVEVYEHLVHASRNVKKPPIPLIDLSRHDEA